LPHVRQDEPVRAEEPRRERSGVGTGHDIDDFCDSDDGTVNEA
jgi:hypothetical protein